MGNAEPCEVSNLYAVELFANVGSHDLGTSVHRNEHSSNGDKDSLHPLDHQRHADDAETPSEDATGIACVAHCPIFVSGSCPPHRSDDAATVKW